MDARTFLNSAIETGQVIRLSRIHAGRCTGRGQGLVLNEPKNIAVLLENCGDPIQDGISAGAIVSFVRLSGGADRYQILEEPAYI